MISITYAINDSLKNGMQLSSRTSCNSKIWENKEMKFIQYDLGSCRLDDIIAVGQMTQGILGENIMSKDSLRKRSNLQDTMTNTPLDTI